MSIQLSQLQEDCWNNMKTKHDNDKLKTVSFTVKRDQMKLEIAQLLKILERKLQKDRTLLLTIMMRKMEIND